MTKKINKNNTLNQTAKTLAVLYILFLGLFALDIFDMKSPWYMMIAGFLIHLIPNYILMVAAIIAWKNAKIGGLIFILFGFIMTIFFRTYDHLPTFLSISLPIFIIGTLFLLGYKYKNIK